MESSEKENEQKKNFDFEIPSEESFAPSETSEKYTDVASSDPDTSRGKRPKKRGASRKRRNGRNGENPDKSNSSSTSSKDSNTSKTSDSKTTLPESSKLSECVQTDAEYLERASPAQDSEEESDAGQILFPKRHVLLLMIFLGFINIYAMRVNLNVAIVAMVNNKTVIMSDGSVIKHVSMFCRLLWHVPQPRFLGYHCFSLTSAQITTGRPLLPWARGWACASEVIC